MPVSKTLRTPGVYIVEEDAFPPSIVGVETAVPAFIGYTEKAELADKPIFFKPQKIESLDEFKSIFGGGFKANIVILGGTSESYDFSIVDKDNETQFYQLAENASSIFYLYASLNLFFKNGGEKCYVCSVGNYTNNGLNAGGAKVDADQLLQGLQAVADITEPAILVMPDATLLPTQETYSTAIKAMLAQCETLNDRVAILDVYDTLSLDQASDTFQSDMDTVIKAHRFNLGAENLSYGMSYFPFLKTDAYPVTDIDYTFFEGKGLQKILTVQANALYKDKALEGVMAFIANITECEIAEDPKKCTELNANLTNALPVLKEIIGQVALNLGILPPSGGMAGIFAQTDNTRGVWNAPANVSMTSVIAPTLNINTEMQEELNAPLDGKAINVIREFSGRGTVVWGARTQLGNSLDYRYIQVRRTLIYIEQSIKTAMQPFVFAANDDKTWVTVKASISNFLQQTWSQGGLFGSTASDAFSVECGLGSTMSTQDILDGKMIVQVKLCLIRPAEFIELTFMQELQKG